MRISRRNAGGKVGQINAAGRGPQKSDAADSAPAAGPGSAGLEVSISAQAAEVSQAKEAIGALPDTRIDMIESIQNEIDSGRYQRDSQVIAKKMVDEALRDSIKNGRRR